MDQNRHMRAATQLANRPAAMVNSWTTHLSRYLKPVDAHPMAGPNRRCLAVFAIVSAVFLAACGPANPRPTLAPSSSAPASAAPAAPLSAPGAGAASALDAYRAMWRAYVAAIRIPDPNYPDLAKYTQGDALKVFVNGLTRVRDNGLVGQGDVSINPSVSAAHPNGDPPTVEISDCVDTSQSHLVKKDGSAFQDTPGGAMSAKATVTRLPDGSWRVSAFALFSVGSC